MEDITSHTCLFCKFNDPSYREACEKCGGVTLPTRFQDQTPIEWKFYYFDISRAISRTPDADREARTLFQRCLKYLMGHSATAIRVGDDIWLAHYPESGEKRYSIQAGQSGSRNYTLRVGEEQALLFRIVEHILDDVRSASRW